MKKFVFFISVCIITLSTPVIGEMIEMHEDPQCLYKILSLRNWQATQKRKVVALPAEDYGFIRFLTKDQIEQVAQEFWPDTEQFVILKFDVSKLVGSLEKKGKSFCLCDGFIPFNSIVESKMVFNHSDESCDGHTMDIVQVGHPVLRYRARELSIDEILSEEIQSLIETMKHTMRAAPGVGLAAPQIGKSIQLAVIEDVDQSQLTEEEIEERKRYPVPFHVIINPRIYFEEDAGKVEFFEGCLSVPEFVGVVPRAETVRVECLNEKAEPIVIHASGWHARILQHEIDHLNGTLYIDRAHLPTMVTSENYAKLWKNKSVRDTQADLKKDV